MAPALGKRKRVTREELERPSRSPSPSSDSNGSGAEDLQAIFQRAFEAKFKPLDVERKKPKIEPVEIEDDEGEEEEESDWSGISDDDEADQVEIFEYTSSRHDGDETSRAELKAFMSSKPPTSTGLSTQTLAARKKEKHEDADPTETTNLKNDLALQRLLRESHILSASFSGTSAPTLTTTGIARHKSTDLHLQSLGAKTSAFAQKKMPMAQRKHEAQKARSMEEKRRANAKEAGIVLEREKRIGKKDIGKRRERGVGGPSIGRFRGGTLSLTKKDVRSITGGGGAKSNGKGKGKNGRR